MTCAVAHTASSLLPSIVGSLLARAAMAAVAVAPGLGFAATTARPVAISCCCAFTEKAETSRASATRGRAAVAIGNGGWGKKTVDASILVVESRDQASDKARTRKVGIFRRDLCAVLVSALFVFRLFEGCLVARRLGMLTPRAHR